LEFNPAAINGGVGASFFSFIFFKQMNTKEHTKKRSKFISLCVMGKPKKVVFDTSLILSVMNNYGETLLRLKGLEEPIILRDSVDEVHYLMGR
jgi:hypothetical protein|tara:strand:- start:5673 stop:5951 length:279 start_codon:yes stop_codon:yes gene_type:complete